jgi:hypothetical protein
MLLAVLSKGSDVRKIILGKKLHKIYSTDQDCT